MAFIPPVGCPVSSRRFAAPVPSPRTMHKTQPTMIRAPPHRVATKAAPTTSNARVWTAMPDPWTPAPSVSTPSDPTLAYMAGGTTTTVDEVTREAARVVQSKKKDVAVAALASAVVTSPAPGVDPSALSRSYTVSPIKPSGPGQDVAPEEGAQAGKVRRDVLRQESYYQDLDVVDPSAPAAAPSSRRRRAVNKPTSEDSVRCYLHEIGEVKLLGAQAEVHLARDIAKLLQLERISLKYKDTTGREPTIPEWANQAGMNLEAFRITLRRGLRAKERMVAANLRLVVSIAKKYLNRGLTFQDLIQEGSIGLIRGAEKFDADKGFKFSTYATWWIRQAITRAIADQSRPIRLPVHVNDTIAAIKKITKILQDELNRPPSEAEIADRLSISTEKLRFLTGASRSTISLETPIGRDSDSNATLGSFIVYNGETPEESAMQNLLREDLENVLNTLTARERDVVRMRYGFDDGRAKTLEEIGTLFSVTRERIRQIESKALRKLRHPNRNAVLREWVYES